MQICRTSLSASTIDIDHDSNIVRKGAISAKYGEKVLIPINMRDGCILGTGKEMRLELFCAAWSWTDYVTNESKGNSKHE